MQVLEAEIVEEIEEEEDEISELTQTKSFKDVGRIPLKSQLTSIYVYKDGKKYDLRDLIDYTDKRTIKFLSKTNFLETIFQLNSDVSRHYLHQIFSELLDKKSLTRTEVIMRLSDITTMIRPAAQLAKAPERYEKRLKGKKVESPINQASPFYPIIEEITLKTQLELLYQEQIMRLLEKIFNISAGKADTMRRSFEKNDSKKLEVLKNEFWLLWRNKATVEQCKEFWNYLLSVSGYLFNLSHAVSYSYNTYQTAYIKCTPELSLAICMDIYSDKLPKVKTYLREATEIGIKVKLPRFNQCYDKPTADLKSHTIFLANSGMKGIGIAASNRLSKRNDFTTVDEFLSYMHKNKVNKAVISILIKIGFFDDVMEQFNNEGEFLNDYHKVWSYIDNFFTKRQEIREKKLIKKYGKFIYKPKKDEIMFQEDGVGNTCIVEVIEKVWDLGEYNQVYKSLKWENFFNQLAILGYPLIDIETMYNRDLDENEKIILIESVKNQTKTTSRGEYKFSLVRDISGNSYFFGNKFFPLSSGFVAQITISKSSRGTKIESFRELAFIETIKPTTKKSK